MATTAALQTLQGTSDSVNPQMVGRQELEAGVGLFTMEAKPGGRQGQEQGQKGVTAKLLGAGILSGGG